MVRRDEIYSIGRDRLITGVCSFMELFNKSGVLVSAVLVIIGALIACQAQEDAIPSPTVIEAVATQIGPVGQPAAERRLQEWADQGSPVAQRELALRYLSNPDKRREAMQLFERAASAGDAQAAVGLVGMSHDGAGASRVGRVIKEAATANYAPH
jgi:TPR repeat protein